jgi:hypothetical protein
MKYLLPKVPRYFKAGLHCHTTISDGTPKPEEMKAFYKAKGYQILSITDHNVIADHSAMNEDDFLMLTGAEHNITDCPPQWANNRLWMGSYHLNFIAKRPDNLWQPWLPDRNDADAKPHLAKIDCQGFPRVYSVENINALIAEANKRGFLVTYNHPHWSMHSYPDYADLKGLWGLEIYNTDCLPVTPADRDNSQVYRDLVSLGNNVVPVAADDAHVEAFVGGGWVMIGAEKLEYSAVIEAMEKGDLYASTGPEIKELSIEDGKLHIVCSDAKRIVAESGTRSARTAKAEGPDGLLQEATFDLSGWIEGCKKKDAPRNWIRFVVTDADGNYATTRAYRAEELL